MKAQGLEAARGEQQDRKAGESDGERAPVAAQASLQAPKGPDRGEHRERDPPPGRYAEQKQQHIGYPGAHPPRLRTSPAATLCDQPGSARLKVVRTRER